MSLPANPSSATVQTDVFPGEGSGPPFFSINLTWTNLGPLTTTFKPPSGCLPSPSPTLFVYETSSSYIVSQPCSLLAEQPQLDWMTCQPSGSAFSSFLAANVTEYSAWNTFLSPGFFCPSGYTTGNVATIVADNATAPAVSAYTFQTTGTHIFCCESGYTYAQSAYGCVSRITTSTSTSLCGVACDTYCQSYTTRNLTITTCDSNSCAVPTPFSWQPSDTEVVLQAYSNPVYLIHQASDVPPNGGSGGLSTGDKIAIGVVVPVVVIAAIIAGCFFLMKKMRYRKVAGGPSSKGLDSGAELEFVSDARPAHS